MPIGEREKRERESVDRGSWGMAVSSQGVVVRKWHAHTGTHYTHTEALGPGQVAAVGDERRTLRHSSMAGTSFLLRHHQFFLFYSFCAAFSSIFFFIFWLFARLTVCHRIPLLAAQQSERSVLGFMPRHDLAKNIGVLIVVGISRNRNTKNDKRNTKKPGQEAQPITNGHSSTVRTTSLCNCSGSEMGTKCSDAVTQIEIDRIRRTEQVSWPAWNPKNPKGFFDSNTCTGVWVGVWVGGDIASLMSSLWEEHPSSNT